MKEAVSGHWLEWSVSMVSRVMIKCVGDGVEDKGLFPSAFPVGLDPFK